MRTLLALGLIGMLAFSVPARADDSPGDKAVQEAIKLLQTKKGQANNKGDREKIDSAIAALQKLIAKPEPADDKTPVPFKPDALKAKFHGAARYDVKTGELTLRYDFENPDQLKDFDLGGSKAKLANATLMVRGAEKYTHTVAFKTVQVTADVAVYKPLGFYLGTTQDFQLYMHETWSVEMWLDGNMASRKALPDGQRGKFLRFGLTAQEKRIALQVGSVNLAGNVTDKPRAGHVVLMGGHNDGAQFRNLVITGVPDPEWVKTFLAP